MLRNIYSKLVIVFIVFLFPFIVHAEEIKSFDQELTVQKDGIFWVRESILYDFGTLERHGIFRTIPTRKINAEGKTFVMDLRNVSVTDKYSLTESDGILNLKIGDADKTVTGMHTYNISYSVSGAFTYFSDHDELYWNVTGNDWEVPLSNVTATVNLPKAVSKTDIRIDCYTGYVRSTESDCTMSYDEKNGEVTAAAQTNLTIVVGFPKGIIAVVEPKEFVPFWGTIVGKIFLFFLLGVAFFWYIFLPLLLPYRWWRYGRDPKPTIGEASAWFAAPKTKSGRSLTPGETGTLVDEKADSADIVATIIDLARRGYLKIVEPKKGDIHLEKSKTVPKETLTAFEQKLYTAMFKSFDTLSLKTGSLITPVADTKNALYDAVVTEGFFLKNPQTTRTLYTVLGVFALFTGNFGLTLSAFIFGMHMPRKTGYGAEVAAVARSLKNFITSQERQFKFQGEKQLLFEKMLPFAIAFGVEKLWIARFATMHLQNPDWYSGYATGRFNAIAFAASMHSTSSSVVHAATPISSSTGHSSGFSGGFSGGGGGGGGGGSW